MQTSLAIFIFPQTGVFTRFETEMVSVEEAFTSEKPELLTAEPEGPEELGVVSFNNHKR